jgi:hypothetical protein
MKATKWLMNNMEQQGTPDHASIPFLPKIKIKIELSSIKVLFALSLSSCISHQVYRQILFFSSFFFQIKFLPSSSSKQAKTVLLKWARNPESTGLREEGD